MFHSGIRTLRTRLDTFIVRRGVASGGARRGARRKRAQARKLLQSRGSARVAQAHTQRAPRPTRLLPGSVPAPAPPLQASANLSAGLAAKQAVVGAAAKAVDDKVSGVLVRANNTLAATTATLQALNGAAIDALNLASKVALDKVNRTKAAAFGVAQLGVGFAQAAQSAVVGNLYDAADVFLKKPMVAAAANFTDDGGRRWRGRRGAANGGGGERVRAQLGGRR